MAYAAVCLSAVARTCWSLDAVSDGSLPLTSTTRMSEGLPSRKSRPLAKPRERLACVMIISPMCSMAAGLKSSRATVASMASRRVLKCSTANPRTVGMGHSLSLAWVTAASVPSEPTITWVRSRAAGVSMLGCPSLSRLYPPTLRSIFGNLASTSGAASAAIVGMPR